MYIVVRNDGAVLSRTSKDALLSWIDAGVTRATEFRYAITFETFSGAEKCAGMQGGVATSIAVMGGSGDPACGVGPGGDGRVAGLGG